MDYITVKWLHILSSTFLFGTGIGSAFYLLATSLSRNVQAIAVVSRHVVIADWLFTTTTAVIQPLTGFYLVHMLGIPWSTPWIYWSIVLYVLAIACWLPVVGLQIRMRNLAREAADNSSPLTRQYWRYFWIWTILGVPALFLFLIIFYLMVAKPS